MADRNVRPAEELGDLLQAEADFFGRFGTNGAGDFDAVFEEDRGGPELYAKGATERAAWAIFHFDVLNRREPDECFGNDRSGGLTVAAPAGAEFEEDRTARGIDFLAAGAGSLVVVGHRTYSGVTSITRRVCLCGGFRFGVAIHLYCI